MGPRPPLVAVCGASDATDIELQHAAEVGRLLAQRDVHVVCGGLSGVMEAVARAVRDAGGTCIGLLPGDDPGAANPGVTIALATGMGEMRNALIARVCTAMIAIGGGHGTLSEIALALRLGRPVVALHSWDVHRRGDARADPAVAVAETPAEAVRWVMRRISR